MRAHEGERLRPVELRTACGSMGVPSANAAAISTRSAASAKSIVSVAVHIATETAVPT